MQAVRKPRWQQATALVSLSTCGAMTGISFARGTLTDVTSPSSLPAHLLALTKPAGTAATGDGALRAAIVNAARYYLRLAAGRTPAQMEALIWQDTSTDGADHGASCAAFASLTLEAGAHAVGQQSWVTGGTSYPWPVQSWVDARVDPNPASPGIISIVQDAEAHHRWHPLGDGYTPQPGDWVLFSGHVEVVTKYSGGVLDTIGGDSMPNLSVNAHQYGVPLAAQGVAGFVNNGELLSAQSAASPAAATASSASPASSASSASSLVRAGAGQAEQGQLAIPGMVAPALGPSAGLPAVTIGPPGPVAGPSAMQAAALRTAQIPGVQPLADSIVGALSGQSGVRYSRSQPAPGPEQAGDSSSQQAFINQIAPAAVAAQRQYGIPAAVTIAQAIDESGWGQSQLAAQDNNLFGIKGTGPAGSVLLPTQEYENGLWVTITAPFRVYNSVAESVNDHTLLLATGSSYKQAMADRDDPDAFANDLTGVYATDPSYGASLISIMRLYNLYRYDAGTRTTQPPAARATRPGAALGAMAQAGARESGAAQSGGAQASGSRGEKAALAPYGPTAMSGYGADIPGQGLTASGRTGAGAPTAGSGAGPAAGAGQTTTGDPAPGAAAPAAAPGGTWSGPTGDGGSVPGGARIPGAGISASRTQTTTSAPAGGRSALRAGPRNVRISTRRYVSQVPQAVTTAFVATAKTPLLRSQPLYQDVASASGIRWQLLAACDWMQCQAQPRLSPVRGEKLGTKNPDGTVYRTKSEALEQCASDLIVLARAVYRIDLTERLVLSVRDLANVFAAFRWGALLSMHHISAMEFPYSVAGLSGQHLKMRWPDIPEPNAPDKPGTRFRMTFGAVPVVLGLNYPAVA